MGMRRPDRIQGRFSVSRRALLWLGRHHGAFRMMSGTCAFQWHIAEDGTVEVRAHGTVVRAMQDDGLLHMSVDGLFSLTSHGAVLAERLLVEPPLLRHGKAVAVAPFWLTDEQMTRVSACFPRSKGVSRKDDRAVISGIVHVLRTSLAWEHAPACYGPAALLMDRFRRWACTGVLDDVFANLMECRDGTVRLVISEKTLLAHRTGRMFAARGCFPIIAPVDDEGLPCAA